METKRICPGCQKPLPPDSTLSMCPECLLKAGLATGTERGKESAGFTPPGIEELGKLFPQLQILSFIGKGGMGAVYKARQPALDRFVALKILPPSVAKAPGFAERFNREARALAKLVHPNIVAVHDFGEAGDLHYLIMEYVDGANLRETEHAGRLSPEQALTIVPQICEALQFAHNGGVVHRDIKPENILLDRNGRVKITDFGIAKIFGVSGEKGSLTGAKDVIGTPHYMAPEQIEHPADVDHRADIFSLGVVFYEMLTGELPLGKFVAPSKKVEMDVRLDEVVLHALEKEPERRYQQANQVKTHVEMIAHTPPPLQQSESAPNITAASVAKNGQITAAAVAMMVAAGWKVLSAFSFSFFLFGGANWLNQILGPLGIGRSFTIGLVLYKVLPAALMVYGGYQMLQRRSYAWSLAAAITAVVSCSLIAFPVGIWALIVLGNNAAKAEFGRGNIAPTSAPPEKPAVSWKTLAVIAGSILFIPVILVVAFLAALAVPALGHAKEMTDDEVRAAGIEHVDGEYRKNFSASAPLEQNGAFSLDNVNGRVEIHGWDSNVVVVKALLHSKYAVAVDAVKVDVESSPSRYNVHTRYPSESGSLFGWYGNHKKRSATVDYTIEVPHGVRLQDISSVNGRIKISGVSGDIATSSVNGETIIDDAKSNLKSSTVNGQMKVQMLSLDKGHTVALDAVNGQLDLSLPRESSARFSVSTVNGAISSQFRSLQPKKEWPVGHNLNGTLGDGGGSVKISTVNGAVSILQRSQETKTSTNAVPITLEDPAPN